MENCFEGKIKDLNQFKKNKKPLSVNGFIISLILNMADFFNTKFNYYQENVPEKVVKNSVEHFDYLNNIQFTSY